MIMSGLEYQKQIPFESVYFTGIVRDKMGRKMSKSLGNSPDLLDLIDKYGADAVRFGIMISSPAGNDLLWDESSNEQGRNFCNKLWNALKLLKMWEEKTPITFEYSKEDAEKAYFAIAWFEARLQQVSIEIEQLYGQFKLSEVLKTLYTLVWDDFCSWYLEWVKPAYGSTEIDANIITATKKFFESLMKLLHPFIPFITEEVYHQLEERIEVDDICIALQNPVNETLNELQINILAQGKLLQDGITAVRDTRNKAQLKMKETIELYVQTANSSDYLIIGSILAKQVNASEFAITNETIPQTIPAVAGKEKFYIKTTTPMDTGNQKIELLKELEYHKGFLDAVDKKLSNERFVQNAKPEIVAAEHRKKADALAKIKMIEESLTSLD
jgi:valyl-tRNA synthetase